MTKVIRTMTPEEEARWSAAPIGVGGRLTLLEILARIPARKPPREKVEPKCIRCGGPVSRPGRRCMDCFHRDQRTTQTHTPKPPAICIDCGRKCANGPRCHACRTKETARTRREAPCLPCKLDGCEEDATETGRCVRHEAVWQRLYGVRV